MEDLLNLNSSNSVGGKVKKFDNLAPGEYLVKSFKLKETNFGLKLYVQINDYYLVLPQRYADKINSDEQLKEINEKKYKMVYKGKNKDEFNKLMIDFVALKSDENIASDSDSDEDDVSMPPPPPPKKKRASKKANN